MEEVRNGLIVESNGDRSWWKDGVLHREDGPAVEWTNGYKSWWINGVRLERPIRKKRKGMLLPKACRGIHNEGCPDKKWLKKGIRYCEGCLKRKENLVEEVRKKYNKVKEVKIDFDKLTSYLEKHPKINGNSLKIQKNKKYFL